MGLLYKIALRNLFRHKGRSLSIGFILIVGAFFMTVGNGFISGMKKGLDKNLIKPLFGDITLMSNERMQDNLSGRSEVQEFIENYETIQKTVSAHKDVERITPIVFGKAAMLDLTMTQSIGTDIDTIGFWGIDYENYNDVYSQNVAIIEGSHLKGGERGILINASLREYLYFMHDIWLLPEGGTLVKDSLPPDALSDIENLKTRNDLVLLGLGSSLTATDVRVPIKGIFKFKEMNEAIGTINDENINLIDIETARECMGLMNPEERNTHLSSDNKNLLDKAIKNPDELFENDDILMKGSPDEAFGDVAAVLDRDINEPDKYVASNRIYNISQVNLKPGTDMNQGVKEINKSLRESGLGDYVRAVAWQNVWAEFSGFLTRINLIFTIFINIIFLAAILMIINALSIAAMERTTEIATMRTVGSRKGFIAGMFVMETSLLSLCFGGLGILLGIAITEIISNIELTTTLPAMQFMFGGSRFSPSLDINTVVSGIIQLGVTTIIAVIYPLVVAKNIKPVDAIRSN